MWCLTLLINEIAAKAAPTFLIQWEGPSVLIVGAALAAILFRAFLATIDGYRRFHF